MDGDDPATLARAGVGVVVIALGGLLLVLAPRYGPHRDELYFASAGDRLAWGYPDQPALVAAAGPRLAGGRTAQPGRCSGCRACWPCAATVVLAAALARVLGGDRARRSSPRSVTATGAVTVFLGHRLTTQTFTVTAWVAVALIAAHALRDDRPRLWLAAGAGGRASG